MKILFKLAVLVLFADASIAYFHYFRDVQSGSMQQQYFTIDDTVWQHARPDLADLRLYSGQNEVPYALTVERGSSESSRKNVEVLQPGTVGGKTQFFVDMSGLVEYDRVELDLSARNYVAKVRVEGQDDLHGAHWAVLASSVIYDLMDDQLGSNTMLRLPVTRYKYLRVTLDGPIKPAAVKGATAEIREEEKEVWRGIGGQPKQEQQGKDSVFTFALPKGVPLERLTFTVDPSQANFRRAVEVQGDKNVVLTSGEISVVHMVRHGEKIDSEQTTLDLSAVTPDVLKVIVHNGDDRPLKIAAVRLQEYERRVYFSSPSAPRLYYGDEKLGEPEYDYAKLFQKDPHAGQVQLGQEETNSAYTGRPDERPWSDRHPGILWIAILAAVGILGVMALKSMKTMGGSKA